MAEQWALVSDFDGTVSADDFFTLAAGRYFTDEMLEPWREYLSGRKKHFDALNEMFGRLRGLPDLPAFVKNIPLDSWFPETVALCHAKKIPVYICSAGCDWYINLLIGGLIGKYGVCLVTNHCDYSVETGLVMKRLPEDHPCYDDNIGVSKAAVVKNLKERGFRVVLPETDRLTFCRRGKPMWSLPKSACWTSAVVKTLKPNLSPTFVMSAAV